MKKDYSKQLSLLCPTCGSDQFSFDETLEEAQRSYTCFGCDGTFSYDEIREANGEMIDRAVEATKAEIVADFEKQLKKMFK